MLRPRVFILGWTCFALVTSLNAAAPSPNAPVDPYAELNRENAALAQENAELKRQVTDLKAQVRTMARQIAQLKSRAAPAPSPPRPFQMPGTERRLETPGRDWVPREFNGQTVYIIPCETGSASTVTTDAPNGVVEVEANAVTTPTIEPTR